MVRQGNISVELVEAETWAPFQEHTAKDGSVYAEVEENAEYYIHVSLHRKPHAPVDKRVVFCAEYILDGKDLGYESHLSCSSHETYDGLFERRNGVPKTRALKFIKPKLEMTTVSSNRGSGDKQQPDASKLLGKLQVHIYEGFVLLTPRGKVGTERGAKADFSSSYEAPDSICIDSRIKGCAGSEKIFRSGAGESSFSYPPSSSDSSSSTEKTIVVKGKLLQTITLHYCSTVGLIHVGILPKPPSDVWERLLKKKRLQDQEQCWNTSNDCFKPLPPAKRIRIPTTPASGGPPLIREYELLDLTDW